TRSKRDWSSDVCSSDLEIRSYRQHVMKRIEEAKERTDRRPRGPENHRAHFASSIRFITCWRYERISSRSAVSSPRRWLTVERWEIGRASCRARGEVGGG